MLQVAPTELFVFINLFCYKQYSSYGADIKGFVNNFTWLH